LFLTVPFDESVIVATFTCDGRTPEIPAMSKANAFKIPSEMAESDEKIRDKALVLSVNVIENDQPIGVAGCT